MIYYYTSYLFSSHLGKWGIINLFSHLFETCFYTSNINTKEMSYLFEKKTNKIYTVMTKKYINIKNILSNIYLF